MKNHEALVPVSTDGTVPEHTVESTLTGELAIDQHAKLVDARTYKEIFLKGMSEGTFDTCANCAQVNKAIGEIKGNGKQCVYMVSEIAHEWVKTETGWVKQSDEWIKANPFVPGVRGERVKSSAYLSDDEVTALKAQAVALLPLATNPAIAPLLAAINAKIDAHVAAVALEAINQVSIRRRKAIMEKVENLLRENDKAGGVYPFTICILETGVVAQVIGE